MDLRNLTFPWATGAFRTWTDFTYFLGKSTFFTRKMKFPRKYIFGNAKTENHEMKMVFQHSVGRRKCNKC